MGVSPVIPHRSRSALACFFAQTFLAALCCLAVLGCNSREVAVKQDSPLTVLVAASMREAAEEIADEFTTAHKVSVTISTGPSSGLAQQILAGAPADVFLSASTIWSEKIVDHGLAGATQIVASNRLVLIVSADNPANISVPEDLLQDAVHHVALAGENVPAGAYAEQALKTASVYDQLAASRRIARGHDVRVALSYVEQGEAEAGIVYSTDARLSNGVKIVHTFPADSHSPVEYAAVLIKRGTPHPNAQLFWKFLMSPEAQSIFRRHGFIAPGISKEAT